MTDELNQAKGDQGMSSYFDRCAIAHRDLDPAEWIVPLESYICTYVQAWVTVKHYYDLSVDSAEKTALENYLADC